MTKLLGVAPGPGYNVKRKVEGGAVFGRASRNVLQSVTEWVNFSNVFSSARPARFLKIKPPLDSENYPLSGYGSIFCV